MSTANVHASRHESSRKGKTGWEEASLFHKGSSSYRDVSIIKPSPDAAGKQ